MIEFVDIAMSVSSEGYYDFTLSEGDIQTTQGLETAIFASIFTDARASDTEIEEPERRRGWIGNINNPVEIGSKNWLYEQARLINRTVNGLTDSTRNALQWLIDFNYATNVTVSPIRSQIQLEADITIFRSDSTIESNRLILWENTPDRP